MIFRRLPFVRGIWAFIVAACTLGGAQGLPPTAQQTAQVMLEQVRGKDFNGAIALGTKAIEQWPRSADLHHLLGLAYFQSGALQPALQELKRATSLAPSEADLHYDLALVLLAMKNHEQAAVALEQSLRLQLKNPLAHILLGRSYLNSNRGELAVREFKLALRQDP